MTIKSDIEIAQEAKPLPITDIADACGMDGAYIEQYGRYKAKIDNRFLKETNRPDGKLVLVTAITPTPAGEGKTTTTVGLADGLRRIGRNAVVAINAFPTDTAAELRLVEEKCRELGVSVALSEVWAKGGAGGSALAEEVVRLCEQPSDFRYSYALGGSIEEKLETICRRIYHADGVVLTPAAQKQARRLTELGFGELPICMAKTQYSFSDDPSLLGAPRGFTVTVRNLKVSAGAGFLVALTGDIMTMPGLPKVPAAERIDVDENGRISGLF